MHNLVYVAAERDLVPSRSVLVEARGRAYLIFRGHSGHPVGVHARCPHRGASLVGAEVSDGELTCPIHRWRFNETGCNVHRPEGRPLSSASLDVVPVVVKDGGVYLLLCRDNAAHGLVESSNCSARARASRLVRYGPAADQHCEVFFPRLARDPAPTVVLIHGGFWKPQYTRVLMDDAAHAISSLGFTVVNLEYRRTGTANWVELAEDVLRGIAVLTREVCADPARTIWIGHSAGGQLALWAAAAAHCGLSPAAISVLAPAMIIGLAPVSDMLLADKWQLGGGAVARLLNCPSEERAQRVHRASPSSFLPLRVSQRILHGEDDDTVPVAMTREYVAAARAAGDDAEAIVLPGIGHMELIDPRSAAWPPLSRLLTPFLGVQPNVA